MTKGQDRIEYGYIHVGGKTESSGGLGHLAEGHFLLTGRGR
jgi:hypothetical protein